MQKERWEYKNEITDLIDGFCNEFGVEDSDGDIAIEKEFITIADRDELITDIINVFLGPIWDPVKERNMTHG